MSNIIALQGIENLKKLVHSMEQMQTIVMELQQHCVQLREEVERLEARVDKLTNTITH